MTTPDLQTLKDLIEDRQHNRLLRLSFPQNDGPDAWFVANELDAFEALSRDFHFRVQVLSDNAHIELKDVQGKMVTISLVREDGSLRYFNGYVFEFRLVKTDGACVFYDMVLLPWLAYLRLRQDNYTFIQKDLHDQTEEIFKDYFIADWKTRLTAPDKAMAYACQFDETDYNYLHRRWEAHGIHYWYEHRADGHTLILDDDSTQAGPIDGPTPEVYWQSEAGATEDDGLSDWTPVRRIVSSSVAMSSFDFKNPRRLEASVPTINQQGEVLHLELYEYAGPHGFRKGRDGEAEVRQRMEEIEAAGKHFEAKSNDRFLSPRRWFKLTGHFDARAFGDDADTEFLVREVRHHAINNYLQNGEAAHYRNEFCCLRKKIPWRPGRGFASQEPKIYGLQTAIVVGPGGQEIWTDEYGRIKVQFHWDRAGQYDDGSSAWVRVASPWTGSGFGFIGIPRVGQEVIVQFLDGNPDLPLVTACVFNDRNMPPWKLPLHQTQTGVLSRSTPGGAYENANAIRFEDQKGHEELWLHAEKNQRIEVESSESHSVGADRSKTVGGNETTTIGKDRNQTVGGAHSETVKKDIRITSSEGDLVVNALKGSIIFKAAHFILLEVGRSRFMLDEGGNISAVGPTRIDLNPASGATAASGLAAAQVMGATSAAAAEGSSGGASAPSGEATAPFKTELGEDVDKLASKSPSLQKDLQQLDKEKWSFQYGPAGGGSMANRDKKSIVLDSNLKSNPNAATQTLAHEVGHAIYKFKGDYSSKAAYVDSTLADEGAATLNNIKVQREVLVNGGPDIGIAGNSANHSAYNSAYDQFLKDGNASAARQSIGAQFGRGEITSNTKQPYADYYGGWYDKAYPIKK